MNDFAKKEIIKLKETIAKKSFVKPSGKLNNRKYRPVNKKQPLVLKPNRKTRNSLLPLVAFTRKSGFAGNVFANIRQVQGLNKKLTAKIGTPLSAHIRLIRIEQNKAVIVANSGNWAQRTRFLYDEILQILNQYYGGDLQHLSIQVARF